MTGGGRLPAPDTPPLRIAMSNDPDHLAGAVATAARLLAATRAQLERTGAALALACTAGGRLSAELLDDQQVGCFEIAWAAADLMAAGLALQATQQDADEDELERRLALLFATDAIAATWQRLQMLQIDLGLDLAGLQALMADAD